MRWFWMVALIVMMAACTQTKEEQIETPELTQYEGVNTPHQFGAAVAPAEIKTELQAALQLEGAGCIISTSQTLICSGWVQNEQDIAYSTVNLKVELLNESNELVAEQTVNLARAWLPSQSGSPFSMIFSEFPDVNLRPVFTLLSAEQHNPAANNVVLGIQNLEMVWEDGVYHIQGEVINNTANRVAPMAVTITLRDADGGIVGFRTIELDVLIGGTASDFETFIVAEADLAEHVEAVADGYQR